MAAVLDQVKSRVQKVMAFGGFLDAPANHAADPLERRPRPRSYSTSRNMAARKELARQVITPSSPRLNNPRRAASTRSHRSHRSIEAMNMIAAFDSGLGISKEGLETKSRARTPEKVVQEEPRSWRDRIFRREKRWHDPYV